MLTIHSRWIFRFQMYLDSPLNLYLSFLFLQFTAENILYMLRPDNKYTPLEAKVLDIALILHAEHGGGNNSTFTTHVVTSSGTDTYSSTAASIGSLKGPRHGGANLKVQNMFTDLKANVEHWDNEDEIVEYLQKVLNKEAFDH